MHDSLTLVGGSNSTRHQYQSVQAEEVWTLAYLHDEIPEATRFFEIHRKHELSPRRWDICRSIRHAPIYMVQRFDDIPCSNAYPLSNVSRQLFGNLYIDHGPAEPFGSTFDYMLGLAIVNNWHRINVFGFDMSTNTEYFYQRPGAHLLIGVALGRGMEVYIAPGSKLIDNRRYGYEGYPQLTEAARARVGMVLDQVKW